MKGILSFLGFVIAFLINVTSVFAQDDITVSAAIDGQTTSTCNAFIIDSGGQGGPGYSNGENVTFTICSSVPGDQVSVTFNLFDLDPTDTAPGNANNSDQMYVFDGPTTGANSLGNYGGNGLQGVVIQATPQNTSGCLTFQFVSNDQGTGSFTASASCNTPCATPFAAGQILGGITTDSIRTCIGEPVSFQETNSFAQNGFNLVNYTWDFMDGSSETVSSDNATVQHAFSQPGHYLVQLFVQDDNPDNVCLNSNFISLDVLVATYPDFIGFQEDVLMCIGEELSFTAQPELYEVTWDGFEGSTEIENGCLPDTLLGISQEIEIFQTGFLTGTTITNVSQIHEICLDLEHSFMGDLVVYIICPNGQQMMLHQQGGGGTQIGVPVQADNIDCDDPTTQGVPYHYCFTPTATETWVEWVNTSGGGTLPEGSYEPVEAFDSLVGCPTNGVWTLAVIDNWAADDGQLFSFSMTLDASLYPEATVFTPQILPGPATSYWSSNLPYADVNDADLDQIIVTPGAVGTYTYNYFVVDDFGCSNDTSFTVTVFDALDVEVPETMYFSCGDITLPGGFEGLTLAPCSQCGDFTYCYDNIASETWNFCTDTPGDGTMLTFTFNSGQMENFFETVTVYDGDNTTAPVLATWATGDASGQSWTATNSTGCLTVTFTSDGSVSCQSGSYQPWSYTVSTGSPEYEWAWNPSDFMNDSTLQSPIISNLTSPTTYQVSIYPTGHPDCASFDEISVLIDPLGDPGISDSIYICSTDNDFHMLNYLGGTPVSNGVWTDFTGTTLANDIFSPSNDLPGVYTHTVTSADGVCQQSAELTILMELPANLTIVEDTSVCSDGEVALQMLSLTNGVEPFSYQWTFNGQVISNQINDQFHPTDSGFVYLTVIDDCDLAVIDSFYVNVLPEVNVTFEADSSYLCWPDPFILTCTEDPANYTQTRWFFSDGSIYLNVDSIAHSFDAPGNYTVQLALSNNIGCEYNSTFQYYLVSLPPPEAMYSATPQPTNVLNPEISFADNSVGAEIVSYQWSFLYPTGEALGYSNEQNPVFFFPTIGGNYIVNLEVTDIHGCVDAISDNIVVIEDILQFYVPTGFTPNGDGLNDILRFEGADIDERYFSISILNRWGEEVYHSTNPKIAWMGGKGEGDFYLPNGIYHWMATVVSKSTGEKKELKGNITLMR